MDPYNVEELSPDPGSSLVWSWTSVGFGVRIELLVLKPPHIMQRTALRTWSKRWWFPSFIWCLLMYLSASQPPLGYKRRPCPEMSSWSNLAFFWSLASRAEPLAYGCMLKFNTKKRYVHAILVSNEVPHLRIFIDELTENGICFFWSLIDPLVIHLTLVSVPCADRS